MSYPAMDYQQKRSIRRATLTTIGAAASALLSLWNHSHHDARGTQTFGVAAGGLFVASVLAWIIVHKEKAPASE